MTSAARPAANAPGQPEAASIMAQFRAMIAAGGANTNQSWIARQRRDHPGQDSWDETRQGIDTENFLQAFMRAAPLAFVRQALEQILHDYPALIPERVEADYIPWPFGWRATVYRALAETAWTVDDAILFARSFQETRTIPSILYWEAMEAAAFIADFYRASHQAVAFLLEIRKVPDFEYVDDVLIRERFLPTDIWAPALAVALRGRPEMRSFLLARLAPFSQTRRDIRLIVEEALRAEPLTFSLDAWRAYAAGMPEDQAFRPGMNDILETLIAASAISESKYNFMPFDLYMQHYPADEIALGHCMRAVFEGGARLRLLAVDLLGERFWRFEQTKSALMRVLLESPEPDARSQAFYALLLRYGADPVLRAKLFQAFATESRPETRKAMMEILGGEPIRPVAPRSDDEKKCGNRHFRNVYAHIQSEAACFLPADFMRHRTIVLAAELAYLKPAILLAARRQTAGDDGSEYHDLLTRRDQAEREKACFEDALQAQTG